MLLLHERFWILQYLRYSCIFNLLPARVDLKTWKLSAGTDKKWKQWACNLAYALALTHTVYVILRFFHALLFVPGVPLHQLVIHGDLAGGYLMTVYWYYVLYLKSPDAYAGFLIMTLTGTANGSKSAHLTVLFAINQ